MSETNNGGTPAPALPPSPGGIPGALPGAAPGGTPPAEKPWYDGVADPVMVGHWQNQGLAGKSAAEVAVAITKLHQDAAAALGAPPDQLLRRPPPGDANAERAFWEKLGAPREATGYDLSGVKFSDGEVLDPGFVDFFQKTAHSLNLPASTAQNLAQEFAKFLDGQAASEAAQATASVAQEREALRANWGPNQEQNLFLARQGAARLGVTPEVLEALEKTVGYAKSMEMFRKVGVGLGEAKYLNGNTPGDGTMSRDQAVARKTELMRDAAWTNRYLGGEAEAVRQMTALNVIISGDSGPVAAKPWGM